MADRVIEDPILNRPYDEPSRHFEFDIDGITDVVAERRRPSSHFVPVPPSRKGGRQLELTELTADQIRLNLLVNRIREHVTVWRHAGYSNVSPTTRRLLEHWADPERENRVLFCQREAAETAIYLAEVAPRTGDVWIRNDLAATNAAYNDGLNRVALKMATGSGKTVVMAMLIAWQVLNKAANATEQAVHSTRFLVVTPGLTIRDRLRVLLPADPDNYYRLRDLVPADLRGGLGQAQIVITNYHAFLPRREGRGTRRQPADEGRARRPVADRARSPRRQAQMVARVLPRSRRLAGNRRPQRRGAPLLPRQACRRREAHRCDERAEAKERNEEARVWLTGLQAVQRKVGVKTVYDLSATPFFLRGSGYQEGTLFPWVVCDFSLIDAIESGIVKIPRVPVDDNQVARTVTYLDLWSQVRDELPKGGRRGQVGARAHSDARQLGDGAARACTATTAGVRRLGGTPADDGTPPVFIVVCSNTNVSQVGVRLDRGLRDADGAAIARRAAAVLQRRRGRPLVLDRPRTILVDSAQLESGEAMSAEFKKVAATEIDAFQRRVRPPVPRPHASTTCPTPTCCAR